MNWWYRNAAEQNQNTNTKKFTRFWTKECVCTIWHMQKHHYKFCRFFTHINSSSMPIECVKQMLIAIVLTVDWFVSFAMRIRKKIGFVDSLWKKPQSHCTTHFSKSNSSSNNNQFKCINSIHLLRTATKTYANVLVAWWVIKANTIITWSKERSY